MAKNKTMVAGATSIGLVRENQEDCAIVRGLPFGGFFLGMSDGMGGCPAGEVASDIAIRQTTAAILGETGSIRNRLAKGVQKAHSECKLHTLVYPQDRGMGATLDAAVIRRNRLYLAHTGDSRVYLHRDGQLTQLTRDHSVTGSYVDEDGRTVTREYLEHCIGLGQLVSDYSEHELKSGDRVILCSDGLFGPVTDKRIETLLTVSDKSVAGVAEALIEAALRGGGWDNVTVIVAEVV